jgi:hypothetical protein
VTTNYERGLDLGLMVRKIREEGGDYDPRWDLADEAKQNRSGFDEFMRGLNAAFAEDA